MKTLNPISMFAAGVAAALMLALWRPGGDPTATMSLPSVVERQGRPAAPADTARPAQAPPDQRIAAGFGEAERPGAAAATREAQAQGRRSPADSADAFAAELKRMSAGYRNRIFLQAIRDRGYYCDGILDTQLGQADLTAWRIACGGTDAYLISAAGANELAIEPLYYTDGIRPARDPGSVPRQRVMPAEIER